MVAFHDRNGLREVSTGVEITSFICSHQDSASSKERCISHERERARDIRDVEYRGGRKGDFQ